MLSGLRSVAIASSLNMKDDIIMSLHLERKQIFIYVHFLMGTQPSKIPGVK